MVILSKKLCTDTTDIAIKAIPEEDKFVVIKETVMVRED